VLPIAIIGGGITGLAAAYELARRQAPFVLLEGAPRVGGLIHTEHVDGFTIDAGPDSVLAQKPAALKLIEELGLGARVIATKPPRTAYVLKQGRLYALPSPSILGIPTTWRGIRDYDLLPWTARVRLAIEPLVRRTHLRDESVGSFFRRRFGAAAAELIAEPLLGGIHAGDIDRLSIRSLFPRFADAEARPGGVLTTFASRRGPDPEGAFRSLADGMGELVAALAGRMPDGSIRCGAPVASISRSGGEWRVVTPGHVVRSSAVIVAVPARAAASLFGPLDEELGRLCAEVPYVSTVSIALAWPREAVPHPLAGSGFVVARRQNAVRITACTWVTSKWEGRAPTGMALLRAYMGGAHDPDAVDLPDGELAAIAARDIGGILGIVAAPSLERVYRWRDAGAQHAVGQLARVEAIERRLAQLPGILVAGSGFRSVGIPDCVADGGAAAAAAFECARMNG
jgi:oxygen-dependent protoporphyrinogen oxidase